MRSVAAGQGARAAAAAALGGATRGSPWRAISLNLFAQAAHSKSVSRSLWLSRVVSPPSVGISLVGRALSTRALSMESSVTGEAREGSGESGAELPTTENQDPQIQRHGQAMNPEEIANCLKNPSIWHDAKRKALVRGHRAEGVAGHVKAEYTSRMNADGTRYPLIVLFPHHCVPEDKHLWADVKAACEFAGAILDLELDVVSGGAYAFEEIRPLEYIFVNSRLYKRTDLDNWAWALYVTVGNRRSLATRSGFLRQGYRIGMNPSTDDYLGYILPGRDSKRSAIKGPGIRARILEALSREAEPPGDILVAAGIRPEVISGASVGEGGEGPPRKVREDDFKTLLEVLRTRCQVEQKQGEMGTGGETVSKAGDSPLV